MYRQLVSKEGGNAVVRYVAEPSVSRLGEILAEHVQVVLRSHFFFSLTTGRGGGGGQGGGGRERRGEGEQKREGVREIEGHGEM